MRGGDRGSASGLPGRLGVRGNRVRPIKVFVDALDLGVQGFEGVEPAVTAWPVYHLGLLPKLYVDGCINQIVNRHGIRALTQSWWWLRYTALMIHA